MHEVSVAERMLEIALDAAARNGGGRIRSARLRLGALCGVEHETLRFAFEICCRGTSADGCLLEVVTVPARLKCRSCGAECAGELLEPCAACGKVGFDVLEGRELRLEAIDLEETPERPRAEGESR